MKIFSTAVLLFIFSLTLKSQTCGTMVSQDQMNMEDTISIVPLLPTQSLPRVNRVISVAVYIVADEKGDPGVTSQDIDQAVNQLNTWFSPIALGFKVCKIANVNNYQWNELYEGKNDGELTRSNFTKNTVNLYLAGKIYDVFGNAVNGFTYMPADAKDFIFISKQSLGGSELAHQMGHFFNLYHTSETVFGNETVARTGCALTGDRCCDTDADPGLAGWNSNCTYTGLMKDANGAFYHPSVKNLMSFGEDACRCYFTPTQFLRMIYAIRYLKTELH